MFHSIECIPEIQSYNNATPLQVQIGDGAPVQLAYDFDEDASGVPAAAETIPRAVLPSEWLEQSVTFAASGTFTVRVTASNQHGEAWSSLRLTALHPVQCCWHLEVSSSDNFLVDGVMDPADIQLVLQLPSDQQLPTDAAIAINYGDGFIQANLSLSQYG